MTAQTNNALRRALHLQAASAAPLLDRLEGVQKSGNGWRAKCPSCGGNSRKVAITEVDGKVLVHDFGGCKPIEVLQAVGLTWADIMPPRYWPDSPEERRKLRQSLREVGWSAALDVLAFETAIVQIAAQQVLRGEELDWDDFCRLVKAEQRIGEARTVLGSKT